MHEELDEYCVPAGRSFGSSRLLVQVAQFSRMKRHKRRPGEARDVGRQTLGDRLARIASVWHEEQSARRKKTDSDDEDAANRCASCSWRCCCIWMVIVTLVAIIVVIGTHLYRTQQTLWILSTAMRDTSSAVDSISDILDKVDWSEVEQ